MDLRLYEDNGGNLYWHLHGEPEWLAMGDGNGLPEGMALDDALAWEDWCGDSHNRWEAVPERLGSDPAWGREIASLVDGVWTIEDRVGAAGAHYIINDVRLLRQRIEESGLSISRWAEDVAWRESRTVERWLSGKSPIPKMVARKLRNPEPHPWP